MALKIQLDIYIIEVGSDSKFLKLKGSGKLA